MVMNNIGIVQSNSQYYLYSETNICLGVINLPNNGQMMYDAKTLNIITRAIAARWGLIQTQSRTQGKKK